MHALCIIHTANYSHIIQYTQFFREHKQFCYIEQTVLNNGMQHTDYTPSATLLSVCVYVIDNTVFKLCIVCVAQSPPGTNSLAEWYKCSYFSKIFVWRGHNAFHFPTPWGTSTWRSKIKSPFIAWNDISDIWYFEWSFWCEVYWGPFTNIIFWMQTKRWW